MMIAAILALGWPAVANAQSAEGLWQTQKSETGAWLDVRIAPCGQALCGTIANVHGASENLVGRRIISGMSPRSAGSWDGGTIWAPDEDKTYRSRMALEGNGLRVKGCIAFICRGQLWTRLQ